LKQKKHDRYVEKLRVEYPEFKHLSPEQLHHLADLYSKNVSESFKPSSIPLMITGAFILWACWLFFNAGSTKHIPRPGQQPLPQLIMMNTILAGSAGGLVALFIKPKFMGRSAAAVNFYDPATLANGILSGLVSVTASCDNILPWAALITGGVSGFFYVVTTKVMEKFRIDDPLHAS